MDDNNTDELDLIWGSDAIARAIGRKRRVTIYMLQKGEMPGAKISHGQWVISRKKLRAAFNITEAA